MYVCVPLFFDLKSQGLIRAPLYTPGRGKIVPRNVM